MASKPLTPIGTGFDLTTNFQTIYDVPNDALRAGVDAVVFNNYSTSKVLITIRISQSSTADQFDEIVTEKPIRAKENYLAPSLIGQAIFRGGIIEAKVSANNSVNGKLTVTEITS